MGPNAAEAARIESDEADVAAVRTSGGPDYEFALAKGCDGQLRGVHFGLCRSWTGSILHLLAGRCFRSLRMDSFSTPSHGGSRIRRRLRLRLLRCSVVALGATPGATSRDFCCFPREV